MDFILSQWILLQDLGKSNPVIAGAISLWGLGVITFLCRNIPANIFKLVKRELTTTLTFNNCQMGTNNETFANFLIWFQKNKWSGWCRSISLNGRYHNDLKGESGTVAGVGDGTHFFTYKKRLFIMTRTRITNSGSMSNTLIYEIEIVGITRNRQIILDMINEFIYDPPKDKLGICKFVRDGWDRIADVSHRQLNTVIINREIKDKIINDIIQFKKSKQWYIDRGLSYKLIFVLHGQPGSGKTSFIKALASYFNAGISTLSFEDIKSSDLEKALSSNPEGNFILVEDFDSSRSTKARKGIRKVKNLNSPIPVENEAPVIELPTDTLSLSSILNALDGVVSLDDTIIFMTTNVIENIDPAILRPGRVDHIYELGKLRDKEVREYIEVMFPGHDVDCQITFDDIMGCDLQKLYFEYRDNVDDFIEAIPKIQ